MKRIEIKSINTLLICIFITEPSQKSIILYFHISKNPKFNSGYGKKLGNGIS
jgi:hypothetical protein